MDIEKLLEKVPKIERFLTADEMDASTLALAREFPDKCETFIAGHTTMGRPIHALKIGHGVKNALILGCPHPNEPIGAMMLEHLTRILCREEGLLEELPYTFYCIKTWDADGVRNNEGWFNPPYTLESYARNFYRPASPNQVEWTFPLDYKTLHFNAPLNETKAVMALIKKLEPTFIFSLHNSAFGGAFWYISENLAPIVKALPMAAQRQNIPLSLGEPEMPCCKEYAQAIFEFPGMPMMYDFYQQMMGGGDPAAMLTGGSSSIDYANKDGRHSFGIVCEMPYFSNPDVMDVSKTDITRGEAMLRYCDIVEEGFLKLKPLIEALAPHLKEDNCYRVALLERLNMLPVNLKTSRSFAATDPSCKELATKAQRFDNLVAMPFYFIALTAGMVVRGAQIARGQGEDAALLSIEKQAEQILLDDCARIHAQCECTPIDIERLVRVQMETALLTAKHFA